MRDNAMVPAYRDLGGEGELSFVGDEYGSGGQSDHAAL
jgi:hypothetical protein